MWLFASLDLVLFFLGAVRFGHAWLGYFGRRQLARRRGLRLGQSPNRFRKLAAMGVAAAVPLCACFESGLVYGLACLLAVPPAFALDQWIAARRMEREFENAGLAYFHALRGLVHAGLGMSAALFQLSHAQKTGFALLMRKSLDGYEEGKALEACLTAFQRRMPCRLLCACIRCLQVAYRQGLPVVPLLDSMIPLLAAERDAGDRLRDLSKGAFAQAGIACAVPWVLFATLFFFQPSLLERFFEQGTSWGLLCGVLILQAAGAVFLGRLSAFY